MNFEETRLAAAKKKYVLIADPDDDIMSSVAAEPNPELPIPLHAKTLRDCERRIGSRATKFIGFFFSPALGHPGWMTMLRAAIAMHPNVPVFLVCKDEPPLQAEELKKIGIAQVFRKPLKFEELCQAIGIGEAAPKTEAAAEAQVEAAPAAADAPAPPESEVTEATDALYVPVLIMTLLIRRPLQFDVYIRLSPGHYTKAWNAGDTVDIKQLDRQTERGVPVYFILKSDQVSCLGACDENILKLIEDPTVTIEMKTQEVLASAAATIDFLKTQGVSQANIIHAVNFAVAAQKAASALARNDGHLRKFLTDMAVQDHAISTAMLGSLVLTNMKAAAGEMFKHFNIALMFHDIALWDQPDEVREEVEIRMTPEQLKLYREHPAKGAEILRGVGGLPAGVLEAIELHHVRLSGQGFPVRPGVTKVNVVAEMIGICSDFAQIMKKVEPGKEKEAVADFLTVVRMGFSPAIVSAFERTFLSLG